MYATQTLTLEKQVMNELQILSGLNNIRNVVLVTTRWSKDPDPETHARQDRHERELANKYWRKAREHGSTMERYDGTKESAKAILTILNSRRRLFNPSERIDLTPGDFEPLGDKEEPGSDKPDDKEEEKVKPKRYWFLRLWSVTKYPLWIVIQVLGSGYFAMLLITSVTDSFGSLVPLEKDAKPSTVHSPRAIFVSIYIVVVVIASDILLVRFGDGLLIAAAVFSWVTIGLVPFYIANQCETAAGILWFYPIIVFRLGYQQFWRGYG